VALALAAGCLILFAAARTIDALLFGASPRDAGALAFALIAFTAISVLAVLVPATRVLRLQPARILRQD
jgi:ABC-type lipoprotein release transport system permease subunit